MATSRRAKLVWASGIATVLLALAGGLTLLGAGTSPASVATRGEPAATVSGVSTAGTFAWLNPRPAPPGWIPTTTAASQATLFYPPTWTSIPGDRGTVTVALRDSSGRYAGYLNVTPRQGAEQLHGWATFRMNRNREEGDTRVRQIAAAEGLRFRDATGSCVIDSYLSKVGAHPYLEIACIVSGRAHTDVFIGAALQSDFNVLHTTLERAASSLLQG
jgi:hypothetical protein